MQEAQTIGDVGKSIPHIYEALDKKMEEHKTYIFEMDGKLCDQVISILIDSRSNYIYVSPDLVDKCVLSNELHADAWLL